MSQNDDVINTLIGLGVMVAITGGVYLLLKSVGVFEAGETISADDIPTVAANIPSYISGRVVPKYAWCDKHREHSEQCQASDGYHEIPNRCIECNGGLEDAEERWCKESVDDWEYYHGD